MPGRSRCTSRSSHGKRGGSPVYPPRWDADEWPPDRKGPSGPAPCRNRKSSSPGRTRHRAAGATRRRGRTVRPPGKCRETPRPAAFARPPPTRQKRLSARAHPKSSCAPDGNPCGSCCSGTPRRNRAAADPAAPAGSARRRADAICRHRPCGSRPRPTPGRRSCRCARAAGDRCATRRGGADAVRSATSRGKACRPDCWKCSGRNGCCPPQRHQDAAS